MVSCFSIFASPLSPSFQTRDAYPTLDKLNSKRKEIDDMKTALEEIDSVLEALAGLCPLNPKWFQFFGAVVSHNTA